MILGGANFNEVSVHAYMKYLTYCFINPVLDFADVVLLLLNYCAYL